MEGKILVVEYELAKSTKISPLKFCATYVYIQSSSIVMIPLSYQANKFTSNCYI